jgi:flavin-dependent dehydrogenase
VLKEQQRVAGVAGHPLNGRSRPERFSAPLTIGADGHNSIFHAACGLTKRYGTRRRYGVTGHLRGVDDTGSYVEVLSHSDGEIYIAPCDEGVSLVALLLEKRAMRSFNGGLSIGYLNFLDGFDRFRGRSAKIELVSPVLAAGPLGFTVEPCHRPGLLLMGDSAGFLDPITGEGMTLALRSVGAAVPLIRDAFACGEFGLRLGQRYAAQRLRLSDDVARFTQLLLTLSRYKFIADRAVSRLSRDRRLFEKLLGIVAGRHKYRDLSLHDKFLLLMG